ncbi:RLA class II histocompatibility antigen, DP alpha-1 chain-like isoform X2 [Parambassis ranga]|nr:RLA class II histocompatibility antigen, DP alpha-1 chain-like isoform X2 [Parambassis ranga]
MRCSALILLMLHSISASQIAHEIDYFVGCSDNGTIQVMFELDDEEIMHVDFERNTVEYTVPKLFVTDPTQVFGPLNVYRNAMKGRRACEGLLVFYIETEHPTEVRDPPDSIMYPVEEVEPGVQNSLVCFVNHFFPPFIKVSWTKNGLPVSEGVSFSQYRPNSDQTFHQFSTLTFTPSEGDIYSCTVEHEALERPLTRIWELDFIHQNSGPDVFCGVGLSLGLLGVAVGTFLFVKRL